MNAALLKLISAADCIALGGLIGWAALRWPIDRHLRPILVELSLFLACEGISQVGSVPLELEALPGIVGTVLVVDAFRRSSRLFVSLSNAKLLNLITEYAPVGIGVWKPEGADLRCLLFSQQGVKDVGSDQTGKLLCESLPVHRDIMPGEGVSLIDAYFGVLRDKKIREADVPAAGLGWFRQVAAPLPGDRLLIVWINITQQKQMEQKLAFQATHDDLTGLLSQRWFNMQAENRVSYRALLLIDLNKFKAVNDNFGHPAGDRVLQLVSKRLRNVVLDHMKICRYGGDEFLILSEWNYSTTELVDFAHKVVAAIADEPYNVSVGSVRIGASVGVADMPLASLEDLLQAADTAMYEAKKGYGPSVMLWSASAIQRRQSVSRLDMKLNQSISEGLKEWEVFYQPIIRFSDESIIGYEALIRWHTSEDPCSPAEFIPRLEKTGLIPKVTEFVVDDAMRKFASREGQYVSINVTPQELETGRLVASLKEKSEALGFPLERIAIEITERSISEKPALYLSELRKLVGLNIAILMDDFGTGYSNIKHVLDVHPRYLKLDGSLVPSDAEDSKRITFCEAIVRMTQTQGVTTSVIAECIETPWQAETLAAMGFYAGQGYLFGRPAPLD